MERAAGLLVWAWGGSPFFHPENASHGRAYRKAGGNGLVVAQEKRQGDGQGTPLVWEGDWVVLLEYHRELQRQGREMLSALALKADLPVLADGAAGWKTKARQIVGSMMRDYGGHP